MIHLSFAKTSEKNSFAVIFSEQKKHNIPKI